MSTYGEYYRDHLDELYDVGQYQFSAMLEMAYPRDYQMGFSDFLDDPTRFLCDECGEPLSSGDSWGADEDDYPICTKCKHPELQEATQ